jgi:hypothetical protein
MVRVNVTIFLALFSLLIANRTLADTVYQGSGTIVTVGDSGCDPATCTETMNFNFTATLPTLPIGDAEISESNLLDFSVSSSFGPLNGGFTPEFGFFVGDFNTSFFVQEWIEGATSCEVAPGFDNGPSCYEIDATFNFTATATGYKIDAGTTFFFNCISVGCVADFTADGLACYTNCVDPVNVTEFTYSQVPEPGTSELVGLGSLGLLILMMSIKTQSRRREHHLTRRQLAATGFFETDDGIWGAADGYPSRGHVGR